MKKIILFSLMFILSITKVNAKALESIYIDDKTCKNDGTLETCVSSETYQWNDETKTLTLNNYRGGCIYFYSLAEDASNSEEVTIHLKGNNVITEKSELAAILWEMGLDGKISSDSNASLIINHERQASSGNSAVHLPGKLTITGGNITVNNNYVYETSQEYSVVGITSQRGIFISGDTNLRINVNSNYNRVFGIVVGDEGINNPEVKIEKPASVEITQTIKNKLNSDNKVITPFGTSIGTTGDIQFDITGTLIVNPLLKYIDIDGKRCLNDGTLETCVSSETYQWNDETKTLTLNNYNGGAIQFYNSIDYSTNKEEITIHLKGNNVITEKSGKTPLCWDYGLDGKITSDNNASLIVNNERQESENNSAVLLFERLTITGGNITVNSNYTFETDKNYQVTGIDASEGIFISGNTKLKINVNSDYDQVFGISVGDEGINNPEVKIEKPASVEIAMTIKNKLNSDNKKIKPFGIGNGTTGDIQYDITGTLIVNPLLKYIDIDGKRCLNDGTLETCVSSETYQWNDETKTLTLNNYNGGAINFYNSTDYSTNKEEITIHLKGNNVVTEKSGKTSLYWGYGLDGKITSDNNASLVVNHEREESENNAAVHGAEKLIVTGGNITVNNNYTFETDKNYNVIGIQADEGIFISGNTNLKINVNSDYAWANGLLLGGNGVNSPAFVIEYPSKLEIITNNKNKLNTNNAVSHSINKTSGTTGEIVETFNGYGENLILYAGDSKENAVKLTTIPENFSDYAYLKIEGAELSNDKNDDQVVDNENVPSNPPTGSIAFFIFALVLAISFVVSVNMYNKNIKNNS